MARIRVPQFTFRSPFSGISDKWEAECEIQETTVDRAKLGNNENGQFKMWVYTPRNWTKDWGQNEAVDSKGTRRAQVWFHGGGFVFCSAETFRSSCCRRAVQNQAVVFAPEIGIAPHVKAPGWFLNGYAALKHIIAEADNYDVDVGRIALTGETAGGYTALGVAMELAKRGEGSLAKLVMTDMGAFNNDFLEECPINFLEEESPEVHLEPKLLHLQSIAYLCDDYKDYSQAPTLDRAQFQRADPSIFPAQMPEDILHKLPRMVLMTREFDHFRRGNELFAARLERHGRLAGLYIQPGTGHGMGTPASVEQLHKDEAALFAALV
eukprot:g2428.t1